MLSHANLYQQIIELARAHYGAGNLSCSRHEWREPEFNALSHTYQILLIELVIHEHRKKYSKHLNLLSGKEAINHMVFHKTCWPLTAVKTLTVQEQIFVLLDDITPDHLPAEDQSYLKTVLRDLHLSKIDLSIDIGWEIGTGDTFLKLRQ